MIFMLMALGSNAQSANGLTAPNWLALTDLSDKNSPAFAPLNDIGALGKCTSLTAAIAAERRMLQADLHYVYGAVCLPISDAGLGVSLSHFKLDAWSQSKLGVAYGRKLASSLSLAIQMNYHRITIRGYGAAGALTPAIGMRFTVSARTIFSVFADNPLGAKTGKNQEKIGSLFTAMLAQHISEKVVLSLRLSREQYTPADICILLKYGANARLQFDGGISLNRANAFAGTSIAFRQMQVRQVVSWSQGLGFGSAIIIEYRKASQDD